MVGEGFGLWCFACEWFYSVARQAWTMAGMEGAEGRN